MAGKSTIGMGLSIGKSLICMVHFPARHVWLPEGKRPMRSHDPWWLEFFVWYLYEDWKWSDPARKLEAMQWHGMSLFFPVEFMNIHVNKRGMWCISKICHTSIAMFACSSCFVFMVRANVVWQLQVLTVEIPTRIDPDHSTKPGVQIGVILADGIQTVRTTRTGSMMLWSSSSIITSWLFGPLSIYTKSIY